MVTWFNDTDTKQLKHVKMSTLCLWKWEKTFVQAHHRLCWSKNNYYDLRPNILIKINPRNFSPITMKQWQLYRYILCKPKIDRLSSKSQDYLLQAGVGPCRESDDSDDENENIFQDGCPRQTPLLSRQGQEFYDGREYEGQRHTGEGSDEGNE